LAKKKADNTEVLKDLVIDAILEKKGQEVVSLDLREIHDTVADYFIIAHGDSSTQVNAIFQSVLETTKGAGHFPYHSEGMKNGEWVIVDFVDVVVHIFYRERRDFYQLEELWSDAKVTKHDDGPAIKPKAVRQPNRKWVVSEDTLEDIERALPAHERAPVRDKFEGRPFAKRKAMLKAEKGAGRKDELRTAAADKPADKKPADKKFAARKAADKKFVDKKIQERKATGKKAPARKVSETKAPVAAKKAAVKKPSTKKK
jgi:ribosome-associated protein